MKKTIFLRALLLSVLCLAFVSCGDDNDSNEETYPDVTGTWVSLISNMTTDAKTNNAEFTEPLATFLLNETFANTTEVTFKKDGTFESKESWSDEVDTGTYTYVKGVITITEYSDDDDDDEDIIPSGIVSFKASDNKLTQTIDFSTAADWCIEYVIQKYDKFKDLDPNSIKIEKMIVTRVWTKK